MKLLINNKYKPIHQQQINPFINNKQTYSSIININLQVNKPFARSLMGASSSTSNYNNFSLWMQVERSPIKVLYQDKESKAFIEKHLLEIDNDPQYLHRQNSIFEWRGSTKFEKNIKKEQDFGAKMIEILEMTFIEKPQDEEHSSGFSICLRKQNQMQLTVVTERVYKLYEYHPKIEIHYEKQITIFQQILASIKLLSERFGCFEINKEMIGYNINLQGKAWIHQNFAQNHIQIKRKINNSAEMLPWEKSIIRQLVKISLLCPNQKKPYKSKFFDVILLLKNTKSKNFKECFESFSAQKYLFASHKEDAFRKMPTKNTQSLTIINNNSYDLEEINQKQQFRQYNYVLPNQQYNSVLPNQSISNSMEKVYIIPSIKQLRRTYNHPSSGHPPHYPTLIHPSKNIIYQQLIPEQRISESLQRDHSFQLEQSGGMRRERESHKERDIKMIDSIIFVREGQEEYDHEHLKYRTNHAVSVEESVILRGKQ